MRAITVAVGYSDLLFITLPYNRHHFTEVLVVTDRKCADEVTAICKANDANVFVSDSFYANGAVFNKWIALEQGLDAFGRHGWLSIIDVDILWPKDVGDGNFQIGNLYTPMRRMWNEWPNQPSWRRAAELYPFIAPLEEDWHKFPLHPNQVEWAGWTQMFHASDPALGPTPWHETNYAHAGCADSWFQRKWTSEHKLRPSFECLHLGQAGVNWCGRVTADVNGKVPPEADERRKRLQQFIMGRHGKSGMDRYNGERLKEDGK